MSIGVLVNDFRPVYSENLLPDFNDGILSIVDGFNGVVSYDTNTKYDTGKSIKATITTPGLGNNIGFTIGGFGNTVNKTGRYILQFSFQNGAIGNDSDVFIDTFINGIYSFEASISYVFSPLNTETNNKNWHTICQSFNLNSGDVVSFGITYGTVNMVASGYFDAFKLEFDDRNLGTPSIYSKPLVDIDTIPSNFKFISELSDLPAPVTGVITLLANYTYYITAEIDLLGNRLVGSANTTILGSSSENSIFKSTGLGIGVPLITSIYTTPIRNISIKDVDTALNFDATSNPDLMALDWDGINFINVPNIGLIKKASNFIFDKGALINSKGLKFDGEIGTVAISNSILSADGLAGDLVKLLSTCIIQRRFRVIYSSVVSFGSTVGINVDVLCTIPVESYILDTLNFSGGGTYLSGVTVTDNKTNFSKCKGIQNSSEISLYYMHGNATATVISATNTPVKVSGTTTSSVITQKFTNTNNRATYNGSLTRSFKISASLSLESGNNQKIGCYISKNGIVSNDSEVYVTTSGVGSAESLHVQTLMELSENDYVEIWIENTTAIANITVTDLNLIAQ